MVYWDLMGFTSGKLICCYGKSPFSMGNSTINGPCSIAMLNYQRVHEIAIMFSVCKKILVESPLPTSRNILFIPVYH